MSKLTAYLGTPNLTDVGIRFYSLGTAVGARITAGIVDTGDGWYEIDTTLAGHVVRWDSTGTADAKAREDLSLRILLESISTRTVSGVTVVSPVAQSGGTITARQADSWTIELTGLGDLAGAEAIWFALKRYSAHADSAALLFLESGTGLTIVSGAASATPADGSVSSLAAESLTIVVDEAVTAALDPVAAAVWSVKMLRAGTVTTLARGTFVILAADIARVE